MPPTEAQRATAKYVKNAYYRIDVRLKKGSKQIIEDLAKANGESVNSFVKRVLEAEIKVKTGENVEL